MKEGRINHQQTIKQSNTSGRRAWFALSGLFPQQRKTLQHRDVFCRVKGAGRCDIFECPPHQSHPTRTPFFQMLSQSRQPSRSP